MWSIWNIYNEHGEITMGHVCEFKWKLHSLMWGWWKWLQDMMSHDGVVAFTKTGDKNLLDGFIHWKLSKKIAYLKNVCGMLDRYLANSVKDLCLKITTWH